MLPRNHPDRIQITFDDRRLVANAGLLLPATLARHLGLPELVRQRLDLGDAPGRANTSDKMMTLVASALAGGDCIDDADVLRTGGTACTLGGTVKAPSTLGTFLRSFRWGHVRQLDRVSRELLARAWQAGAGPGDGPLTIDLDSTICETYGLAKEGARHHGYTGKRGYHPLLAIAAGTGDVLMSRLREGRANTARGAAHFLRETVGRVRYAGANGRLTLRADSGFYTHGVVSVCRKMDVRFSITIRQHKSLHNLIKAIPEDAWTPIPYWMDGAADVAETTCTPFQAEADAAPVRLIVRRVKPTPGSQLALFAKYSYHGFITDRDGELLELEADHRRHAEIENAIRDLKYGVGLNHLPSGRFAANGAWLAVQTMAHNLARWTARIGLGERIATTKTLRRRFFSLAGRLTRSARRLTLHLPDRWPWAEKFSRALARLRAIPTPGLTAPSATDPPTGQPKIPADSCQPGPREFPAAYSLAIPRIATPADGHRGPCAAMKTVRRPPYPKWNPGYFPCSSLTPLPLSSRRPSVSFGGFGLRLNHPDRRRLVSEPVGKQCRGPSVEAFLFGQSPGNWAYPASPSESTLRLQVHLSIRTGSSLLTLDHVEPPSVHNNRPVGKWAIPPGLSIYPRAAPLGSSHHHCHPRCHTKLEVGAFSIIELDNYWLDTATTDIIAGPLP